MPKGTFVPFENMKGFNVSKEHALNHEVLMKVISILGQNVIQLIMDMHGNHVIQAFLIQFKAADRPQYDDIAGARQTSKYTDFIFDACISDCVNIGMHKHGCCVMQRCLEKGSRDQKLRLSYFIIENLHNLIEDPYGNYLVQNVLKLEDREKNEQIFRQIAKDFISLSQLKFSSNVIEKCLDSKMAFDKDNCEPHIDKILKGTFPDTDDEEIIREFGYNTPKSKNIKLRVNFIVQKLVYN